MAIHGILQHEGMRQIVDVLARTGKVCEFQNLHTSGQNSAMSNSATCGERMDIRSPFEGLYAMRTLPQMVWIVDLENAREAVRRQKRMGHSIPFQARGLS